MRVGQPPDSLVDVDILYTETYECKDKHHALKEHVAVSRNVRDVGVFWLYHQQC